jgi:hypothetical protein
MTLEVGDIIATRDAGRRGARPWVGDGLDPRRLLLAERFAAVPGCGSE